MESRKNRESARPEDRRHDLSDGELLARIDAARQVEALALQYGSPRQIEIAHTRRINLEIAGWLRHG